MNKGVLSKTTVIDMTEGVAGPYAASMLGDMGANVIKVERTEGDWSRTAGKHSIGEVGSTQFVALNRNKRGVGLDLGTAEGRVIAGRMVGKADVLLSNFRAGVMAKLGLGFARCRELRPDIVYCTISGFGQDGPYAQFPASDTVLQALSGVMNLVGEADGPPLRVGFPLIDIAAANHAVQAVLLALYGRLSGQSEARQIDVSLMAAAMALMNVTFTDFLAAGRLPQRHGNQNAAHAPAGAFEVAGGRYITLAILRDSHWQKLCTALGLPALPADARFATNALRVEHRAALDAIIAPLFKTQPAEFWIEKLRAADIICGPVNSFADIIADTDLAAGLPLIDPQLAGVSRVMGNPIRIDGAYFTAKLPPPARGQHTREVLAEFGFSADEIAGFVQTGSAFVAG
jgi:crotonobetainyl-CoA:carnitine CoA-transferase CaiB-like acyl-CoA transferase